MSETFYKRENVFIYDSKMAMKAAGVRLKPLPRSRKRRLRIKRRDLKQWEANVRAMTEDHHQVERSLHADPLTGLLFTKVKSVNRDGTVVENYSLNYPVAAAGSGSPVRVEVMTTGGAR